jgi:hypothetical protein
MSFPGKQKPTTFVLLVESPVGVTEYVIGATPSDDVAVMRPIVARTLSGKGCSLSASSLQQALHLRSWAQTHASIFHTGRVDYGR